MPAGPPPETGGYGHEPELFAFWKSIESQPDVYEVKVGRPLGIVFEEIGTAARPQGVKVIEVQAGSNAAAVGGISVGDVLVGVSAVRYIGGEYLGKARPERDIFPAGCRRRISQTGRGGLQKGYSAESRRRRGSDVDIPWRRVARASDVGEIPADAQADKMDFDTVVGAISSNEEPECDGVVLRLRKA